MIHDGNLRSQSPDGDFFDPALSATGLADSMPFGSQSPDGDFFDPAFGSFPLCL